MNSWARTLEITSHHPCRTTLAEVDPTNKPGDHKVLYTISTDESGKRPITTYVNASGSVFATLMWRMNLPDKLKIGDDGESKVVGKWLKKEKKGKKAELVFESGGHTYNWRGIAQPGPLTLYSGSDIIAEFTPYVKGALRRDPDLEPAKLRLSTRAVALQDEVVLSLLLIEKGRAFGRLHMFDSSGLYFMWLGILMAGNSGYGATAALATM